MAAKLIERPVLVRMRRRTPTGGLRLSKMIGCFARLLVAALCGAVLWCSGAAAQIRELPGTRFISGAWAGYAYRNVNNPYGGCFVAAPRPGATALGFFIATSATTPMNLQMAITNRAWNLAVGRDYAMAYWVDNNERLSVTGRATSKTVVLFDIEDTTEIFERFRAGNTLNILGEGRLVSFSLSGTSAALDRLRECFERNSALLQPGPRPPQSATPSGKPAPPGPSTGAAGAKPVGPRGGPGVSARAQ
jgi:hypothetical protein